MTRKRLRLKEQISYNDFEKVDLRVGRVTRVEDFVEAVKPAYKVWVDFGLEIGVKQSSAQIRKNQSKEELLNKEVICVVNFPPKQIGPFRSEVLILGAHDGTDDQGNWIIIRPWKEAPVGSILK